MQVAMIRKVCASVILGAGVLFAADVWADAKWSASEFDTRNKRWTLKSLVGEGVTATEFYLSDAGVLSTKTAGTETELDLRSAALPDGLVDIVTLGRLMHYQFKTVEVLYLPETVETLVNDCCNSVPKLREVVFPENCKLTKIPPSAFASTQIESLEIPESVKEIGASAFLKCLSLKYVKLPANLEVLGKQAFSSCSALELVEPCIPGSVTNLGMQAFIGCSAMTNDVIVGEGYGADGQPRWVNIEYDVTWRNWAFKNCHKVKRLIFGPGAHNVPTTFYEGDNFSGCEYIEFGVNVTNFSDSFNCRLLTNIVFRQKKDMAIRDIQLGWADKSYHPFPRTSGGGNEAKGIPNYSLREITWSGWFTYSLGSGNPFSNCTALELRFFVPGDNAKWAAWMADATKMTPWAECSDKDKAAYFTRYGADAQVPVGISVAVSGGLNRTYILTDGTTYEGNTFQMGELRSEFGTVTYDPAPDANGNFAAGDVKVKFVPANDGVVFTGWKGASTSTDAEITIAADGVKTLCPTFTSTYLVYDEEKNDLTDGSLVFKATGARDAITVVMFRRVTAPGTYAADLSKPILNGGKIIAITGIGTSAYITSMTLPSTLEAISGFGSVMGNKVVTPFLPDGVTNIASSAFHWAQTMKGNLRIGFATNAAGESVETKMGTSTMDRMRAMGPELHIGPGVRKIPYNTFAQDEGGWGQDYKGAIEVWFGSGLTNAVGGACVDLGGSNPTTVHFEGDMFDGTSAMFYKINYSSNKMTSYKGTTKITDYHYRFYVAAEGCKKWLEFVRNTDYVKPWSQCTKDEKAAYWAMFPAETFGEKHPYGLTTEAAVLTNDFPVSYGLPKNQWVFSLTAPGFVIRVQ